MPNYSTRLQHLPVRKSSLVAGRKIDGQTDRERLRPTNSKLATQFQGSNGQKIEPKILPRWWSGGVAGAITQTLTAPLDLLESRMVSIKKDRGLVSSLRQAIKTNGITSLYDGLSAQLVRQLTYTTMRFHLYEWGKLQVDECGFLMKVSIASLAGCVAGLVGIPTEVVNTRMQVDRALPSERRRNYRNVIDGLYRVGRDEGLKSLYCGFVLSCVRSAVSAICQNAAYDQAKEHYMQWFDLKHDNTFLHLISSVTAACIFGPVVQPLENIRTIKMVNSVGVIESFSYLMRFGPLGPFRGMVPAMMRLVPNTIITFLLYEKIRINFGYYESDRQGL